MRKHISATSISIGIIFWNCGYVYNRFTVISILTDGSPDTRIHQNFIRSAIFERAHSRKIFSLYFRKWISSYTSTDDANFSRESRMITGLASNRPTDQPTTPPTHQPHLLVLSTTVLSCLDRSRRLIVNKVRHSNNHGNKFVIRTTHGNSFTGSDKLRHQYLTCMRPVYT